MKHNQTNNSHCKHKIRTPRIRWKIFTWMLVPMFLLLILLWVSQTIFLGWFYGKIKTDELKKTTENVIGNMESADIKERILFLSSSGDINIRIYDTTDFQNVYSTGESFDSVMYGFGAYGIMNLYNDVRENGGELVRHYSQDRNFDDFFSKASENQNNKDSLPFKDQQKPSNEDEWTIEGDSDSTKDEYKTWFHERYSPDSPPAVIGTGEKHVELLYARISTLSNGTEVMVVADTRISPLNSMVNTLRHQLVISTAITVIVALILSFVISKRVSKPIEKINNSAKNLATGNFNTKFEGAGYREIEQLSSTLNYASGELGKVETLRRELMANVSHDMRTPLTMIVGYSEVMRDLPGENSPENIQVVIDEANRLTEFVNSVIDLSKLQSGMEKLDIKRVNITQMLRDTEQRYTRLMADKDCVIELEAQEDVYVMCDETKMSQVLFNLTDNAINYSREPKQVKICQTATHNKVRIEISDNGEGIVPEELPYIWDRYYKTEKSHKRNVVGSGIGLSIVKEIFKLHGVRYGVKTKKNAGSTFWFEFPQD